MKVALKRFTTNARLSQETTAFAADVWVDGKKVGHAENDGHGGATMVHLDPAVRAKVEAHGKTLVPTEYRFTSGAEWIVDQLVEVELGKRFDKKIAKTDAKEKSIYEKQGLRAARFLHKTPWSQGWTWFSFKPGADPKAAADAIAAQNKTSVDELVVLSSSPSARVSAEHTTLHRLRGKPIEFTGDHLFMVTATTDDGQTAVDTIAANDERTACTRLMAIQRTMKLAGQVVNYRVINKDA